MRQFDRGGITLIEMVVVILVLALAIPILLRLLGEADWQSVRTAALADATFYAQRLMEVIRSKAYDEKIFSTYPPFTDSTALGPDTGETCSGLDTGSCTYDDIDDFNGYTVSPAGGYTYNVTVTYALLSGTTWTDCATPITCTAVTDCTTCAQCCYKRIDIKVSRNDNLVKNVELVSIDSYY